MHNVFQAAPVTRAACDLVEVPNPLGLVRRLKKRPHEDASSEVLMATINLPRSAL